MMVKYTVLIEKGPTSYGAYVPDLPGCVAAGTTVKEVQRLIREAIAIHLEAMVQDGEPIPVATTFSSEVEIELEMAEPNGSTVRARGAM
jgi:predicted RNase H-like HicB family nuclease